MVVQSVVNGFGFIFVAGFTATNKLYGLLATCRCFFWLFSGDFVGQNLGAKEYDRVRKGTKVAWKINVSISIVLALIMVPFGKVVLHLFVSGDPTQVSQVLAIAYKYF